MTSPTSSDYDAPASQSGLTGSARNGTGLLPSGLSDQLFPVSAQNVAAQQQVISFFTQAGYQLVKPPLVEFEETLIDEALGASLSTQTFRLLDPISRRMMALRADMTAQVARISGTRLSHLPRPLRLAYFGDVMRVVPDVLNPERQMEQVGAEIIGRDDDLAVAEIIMLGVQALKSSGLTGLTVDLSLPQLAGMMITPDDDAAALAEAISQKDSMSLRQSGAENASLIADIIEASGHKTQKLSELRQHADNDVSAALTSLLEVHEMLSALDADLVLTLDPMDGQGAGYHSRIAFSFYAEGVRGPVASGGAYLTGYDEAAIGLSVYMERVLKVLPDPQQMPRLYIPASVGLAAGLAYMNRGRHVIFGSPDADAGAEARALECQFILSDADGQPEPVARP